MIRHSVEHVGQSVNIGDSDIVRNLRAQARSAANEKNSGCHGSRHDNCHESPKGDGFQAAQNHCHGEYGFFLFYDQKSRVEKGEGEEEEEECWTLKPMDIFKRCLPPTARGQRTFSGLSRIQHVS